MFRKNKLGIDIDDREYGRNLLRYFRILGVKGFYRISSSKRGYHFKLNLKINITKKDNLVLRYMLGDCYGRFKTDIRRYQHGIREFDVLFHQKKGKNSGKWKKI